MRWLLLPVLVLILAPVLAGCLGNDWTPSEQVSAVAWSSDGTELVTVTHRWEQRESSLSWVTGDLATRGSVWEVMVHDGHGKHISVLNRSDDDPPGVVWYDGRSGVIVMGGWDRGLEVLDLSSMEVTVIAAPSETGNAYPSLAPDGTLIALPSETWDLGPSLSAPEELDFKVRIIDLTGSEVASWSWTSTYDAFKLGLHRVVWAQDSSGVYACLPGGESSTDFVRFIGVDGRVSEPAAFPTHWEISSVGGPMRQDGLGIPRDAQGDIETAWHQTPPDLAMDFPPSDYAFADIPYSTDLGDLIC